MHWISANKTNHAIRWIVIYPVDSVIHLSNNRVSRTTREKTCLTCYLHTGLLLIDIRPYSSIDMTLLSSHTGASMDRWVAGSPLKAQSHIH